MRLSSILKVVAALLVLLVVAVISAGKSLKSGAYNAFLAERIKAATGLDAAFDGATKLKLGLSPMLSFTGVTLSAGRDTPVLYIDRIEAPVALPALALRQLRLDSVTLIRPVLHADHLARPVAAKPLDLFADSPAGAPATRLALTEIRIVDAVIRRQGEEFTVMKARLVPEGDLGGPLALQADGHLRDLALHLSGTLGSPTALAGGKPYPIHLKLTAGGANLTLHGTVGQSGAGKGLELELRAQGDELTDLLRLRPNPSPLRPLGPFKIAARLSESGGVLGAHDVEAVIGRRDSLLITLKGQAANLSAGTGIDLAVAVEAESLSDIARPAGLDLPAAGPLKLSGRLTDQDGGRRLSGLKANLGHGDLAGDLSLIYGARPRLSGKLTAGRLVLSDFSLPAPRPGDTARTAQPQRPAIPIDDGRLLSVAPLPLDLLDALDADLALHVARLEVGAAHLTDASAVLRLAAGRLSVENFSALAGHGRLTGDMRLDISGKVPTAALRLSGAGLDPAALTGDVLKGTPADFAVDLRAQGSSARAMAGSLEGSLSLALGEATLSPGRPAEAAERVMREADAAAISDQGIRLRCFALRLPVKAGLIAFDRGAGFETARGGGVAYGSVDLRTEAVDLAVASRSAPPLRIKGTLGTIQMMSEGGIRAPADSTPCRTVQARRLTR